MTARHGFGEAATATLLVSVMSGFVIALQYEPALPFISTVSIEAELPFGAFWRSLHFWSSQFFLLALCLHTYQRMDAFQGAPVAGSMTVSRRRRWAVVSSVFPFAVMALFTGYVLRSDGTGQAAGSIAGHLAMNVPLAGKWINRMFFAVERDGVNRVYALHVLLAALCWGIGTWYHTGRVILGNRMFVHVLSGCVLWAMLVNAPIDMPGENLHLIKGPWFFVGIQEMLRDLPPLYAGIIFPAVPVILLSFLPWFRDRSAALFAFLLWLAVYSGFTLAGFLR